MTKKPFTEEQEERIYELISNDIDSHERRSTSHLDVIGIIVFGWLLILTLGFILLLFASIVPDTDQLKAEIYQELGYKEVCIESDFDDCYVNCLNANTLSECTEWQWQLRKENDYEQVHVNDKQEYALDCKIPSCKYINGVIECSDMDVLGKTFQCTVIKLKEDS